MIIRTPSRELVLCPHALQIGWQRSISAGTDEKVSAVIEEEVLHEWVTNVVVVVLHQRRRRHGRRVLRIWQTQSELAEKRVVVLNMGVVHAGETLLLDGLNGGDHSCCRIDTLEGVVAGPGSLLLVIVCSGCVYHCYRGSSAI